LATPILEDEIRVSNFYIYLFDKPINQYRKIIKLDINNIADNVYLNDGSLGEHTTHLSFHFSEEVHIRHKEILDTEMCKKKFDIGKIKNVGSGDVQVDWKKEDVGGEEIFSIYYRTDHISTKEIGM
jgi:hypothetical protein